MPKYVESLNQSLHELMAENDHVYLIGEDLLDPYGGAFKVAKGLSTAFPDRVIPTPISEAGLTGFAIGMALDGLAPIVEIMFGDFITLCTDQIVNHAAKFQWMYNDKIKAPLVIRTPMGGRRGYGPTHSQTLETLFFNVPLLKVVAPSLWHDPGKLLKNVTLEEEGPVLFIENKTAYAQSLRSESDEENSLFLSYLTESDPLYPTARVSIVEDETPDLTLICYGGMAGLAVEAAHEVFMKEEILVETLIPSSVKPWPLADILGSVSMSGRALVVEEGCVYHGWGAEVSSQLHEKLFGVLKGPVGRLGSKNMPIPCAKQMEEQVLLGVDEIEKKILEMV